MCSSETGDGMMQVIVQTILACVMTWLTFSRGVKVITTGSSMIKGSKPTMTAERTELSGSLGEKRLAFLWWKKYTLNPARMTHMSK